MEDWSYQQPPTPSVNGGWYTGATFPKNAPWRNINVTPDVSFMIHSNLRSAKPPLMALNQYPGSYRPGNNAPSMIGVIPYGVSNDMMCTQPDARPFVFSAPPPKFVKYAYLD